MSRTTFAFADKPGLLAGHALHAILEHPVLMTIRNPDTAACEETCQPILVPRRQLTFRHFCSAGIVSAKPQAGQEYGICGGFQFLRRENQGRFGRIDVLAGRQTHRPFEAALAQSLARSR